MGAARRDGKGERLIYQAYEAARWATRPLAAALDLSHRVVRHEANPLRNSLAHRALAAALEMPLRGLKDYRKQPYRVKGVKAGREQVLDQRIVASKPFADLLGFAVENAAAKPRVLIAAALSGHHATLLEDTVRGFARDFAPFITDWKDARQVPLEAGDFGLDDYVAYLIEFLKELGPGTHLVATCQAAPPAMVAAAVLAARGSPFAPASLTLMAGPVDTRINPGLINKLSAKLPLKLFEKNNIHTVPPGFPGSGRRVYPGFYQLTGFIALNPLPHVKRHFAYLGQSVRGEAEEIEQFQEFYDEYFAVLDMTESFYMDSLEKVFFEHHIPDGKMTWRGERVDFAAATMPLLTVEGGKDGFCPPGQTEAAHAVMANVPKAKRGHQVMDGVGHYGIFSGSQFQTKIYPVVRDFIRSA